MPVTILVVEKNGEIKEVVLKSTDESELYKKAGFKSADGFQNHAQWNVENLKNKNYCIHVYGKTSGRANQENKYEFPPPIDNTLFFGNCVLVNKKDDNLISLSANEWVTIYEHLYGGFEDLGDEDSEEDSEYEEDDLPRTKSGYVKDDFVVDDDVVEDDDVCESNSSSEEDSEDSEEEEIPVKKTKPKSKKATTTKTKSKAASKGKSKIPSTIFAAIAEPDANYLDCTSELSEESYVE
jgi:hypothetical protein